MSARRALKAVLVDLNGTLHVEDSAVPGAQEALKRLRSAPVTVRFVTNTTKESKRDLLERLTGLGFDIAEHEIFTSLTAARNLLEQQQVRPLLLVDDKALPDFTGIGTDNPNAVVVGLAPEHFHYEMMNRAFRLILDGAPLIAIHKARYFKKKDGLCLGPGPFVTGLEYATDTKATVVGKPEKTFFLEALRGTGCAPEEAVMIGDVRGHQPSSPAQQCSAALRGGQGLQRGVPKDGTVISREKTELGKGLEPQERLRELGKGLSLEKRRLRGPLWLCTSPCQEGTAGGVGLCCQGTGTGGEGTASGWARGGLEV
uniref:Haloacid dehalogenase-like hydrolase domain-containing protein 2 n=44 Tax=Passeriformes TaxID=9126 RepID=A0A8C0VE07_CYACU